MKCLLNLSLTIAALALVAMVGVSTAQTESHPKVIKLESREMTKVVTGIVTQRTGKFYLLQNNAGKKKNVHVRLTPANQASFGVYGHDGMMLNEGTDGHVFDTELADGETIKFEIGVVRAKKSQFTLVITARDAVAPPTLSMPNSHRHARGEDMLSDVRPDIKIVEANVPSNSNKENVVENKAKTFRAFTMDADGFERIFFEDITTNKTYEIKGVDLPGRPLNDPVCVDNFLIFDRSMNPQRSIHYAFDLNKRIIVAGRAF